MKKLSVIALAVLGLVAAMALTGVSANARKADDAVKTKVTIEFNGGAYGDQFSGKLKSDVKKCRKGRTVKVKMVGDGKFGSDKSDKKGRWQVSPGATVPTGDYFAKAKKKVLKNGTVCKKGKSKTITVN